MEGYVTEQRAISYENARPYLERNNVLNRLLICDSDGQHKLPKARQRLKQADVEAIDTTAVEIPIIPQNSPITDTDDYSIF